MTTQIPKPTVKQKGILFLERNRLQLYAPAKQAVLVFDIAQTIAHDMEIFNKLELETQLLNFLKTNAVPPTDYLLILAQNILFEKDFTPPNPDEQKKFLDSVPFEYISTKEFPITGGIRIVAANGEFYTAIGDILEQAGSSLEAVIPYFTVSPQMNTLDQGTLGIALAQFLPLKKNSLTPTKEPELVITNPEAERKAEAKKKDNKTLLYTIPFFILLIGVLAFMLLRPASKPVTSNTQAAPPPSAAPISNPTVAPVSPTGLPISITKDKVSIQITYDTSVAIQAQGLKDKLLQAGYTKTTLNDGGTVNAPKPLMLVSTSLPADLKNDITTLVKKAYPEVTMQENSSVGSDVVITIGK